MVVVSKLNVQVWEQLGEPTRERHCFGRVAGISRMLDQRREHPNHWRTRQTDELSAAVLFEVAPIDARAAEVRVGKMGQVRQGHQSEPGLVVAGDQQQLARLFGPRMARRLGQEPEAQPRQVVHCTMASDGHS